MEKARGEKRRLESEEGTSGRGSSQLNVSDLSELLVMSEDALDTDNESIDPSFNADESLQDDIEHIIETFREECTWIGMTK